MKNTAVFQAKILFFHPQNTFFFPKRFVSLHCAVVQFCTILQECVLSQYNFALHSSVDLRDRALKLFYE